MSAPFDLSAVIRQVHFAFRPDGAEYAGGDASYAARVGADGAIEFTPVAHPDAQVVERPADPADPRSMHDRRKAEREVDYGEPLEGEAVFFETVSIARGGYELATDAPWIAGADDGGLVLDRGAAVEHLKNAADGVHQSWYFAGMPAGGGDLLVRVAVDGFYEYEGETDGGLHFTDPDSGLGTRYGHATWIDADGTETKIRAEWRNGGIALVVPEDVLATSAYPATLDPVIGPEFGFDNPVYIPAPNNQSFADVAFDGTNYLVVWRDNRTGSHNEIVSSRVDTSGIVLDPLGITIRTTSSSIYDPDVTFGGAYYLVVWQDSIYRIHGSRVSTSGVVVDKSVILVSYTNRGYLPDVAFDGTNYLVVWDNQDDVYGARVNQSGTVLDYPSAIPISTATNSQDHAVVAFDGINYLVVWQDKRSGSNYDIYGSRVSTTGAVVDTSGFPISVATGDQRYSAISSNGVISLVVWTDGRSGSNDIYGSRVSQSGVVLDASGIPISTYLGSQVLPNLASDGVGFLVAWEDRRGRL